MPDREASVFIPEVVAYRLGQLEKLAERNTEAVDRLDRVVERLSIERNTERSTAAKLVIGVVTFANVAAAIANVFIH